MSGLWPDLLLALSVVFGSLLVFAGSLYALKRSKRIYMKGGYLTFNGNTLGYIKDYQLLFGETSPELVIPDKCLPSMKWKPIVRGIDLGSEDQVVVKVTIPKIDVKFHIPGIEPSPEARRVSELIEKAVQDQIKKGGGYVRS